MLSRNISSSHINTNKKGNFIVFEIKLWEQQHEMKYSKEKLKEKKKLLRERLAL